MYDNQTNTNINDINQNITNEMSLKSKIIPYFDDQNGFVECFYLILSSNTVAKQIYEDKEKIMKKHKNFDLNISHLLSNISEIVKDFNNIKVPRNIHSKYFSKELEKFNVNNSFNVKNECNYSEFKVENAGLLLFPMLSVPDSELYKNLPKKNDRVKLFQRFIEHILLLKPEEYFISQCHNLVNNNYSYNYFVIGFENSVNLNRFYHSQPFFNCVTFHKFSHLALFPLITDYHSKEAILKNTNFLKRKNGEKLLEKESQKRCLICHSVFSNCCVFELCENCCLSQLNLNYVDVIKSVCRCSCSSNSLDNKVYNNYSNCSNGIKIKNKYEMNVNLKSTQLSTMLEDDEKNEISNKDFNCYFSNNNSIINNNKVNTTNNEISCLKCVSTLVNNEKQCNNQLCLTCCTKQINNSCCKVHIKLPYYVSSLCNQLNLSQIQDEITKYSSMDNSNIKKLSEVIKLKFSKCIESFDSIMTREKQFLVVEILEKLRNSDFSFFRPISKTSYSRLIKDMNKELVVVMDNTNFHREACMTIKDRMYKCYSFQNEINNKNSKMKKLNIKSNKSDESEPDNRCVFNKGIDNKGDYFMEYGYNKENSFQNLVVGTKNFENLNEQSCNSTSINQYQNIKKKSANDFHIIIYELDSSLTNTELVEEIFQEMKSKDIKIIKDGINVVNESSIISK